MLRHAIIVLIFRANENIAAFLSCRNSLFMSSTGINWTSGSKCTETYGSELIILTLNQDSLNLIERNLIVAAVVEAGCAGGLVISHLLSYFKLTAVP